MNIVKGPEDLDENLNVHYYSNVWGQKDIFPRNL